MTPEESINRILKAALNDANRVLIEITEEVARLRVEVDATDAFAAGVTAERERVLEHLACVLKNEPEVPPGLRIAMEYIRDGRLLTDKGRVRYAWSHHPESMQDEPLASAPRLLGAEGNPLPAGQESR